MTEKRKRKEIRIVLDAGRRFRRIVQTGNRQTHAGLHDLSQRIQAGHIVRKAVAEKLFFLRVFPNAERQLDDARRAVYGGN